MSGWKYRCRGNERTSLTSEEGIYNIKGSLYKENIYPKTEDGIERGSMETYECV